MRFFTVIYAQTIKNNTGVAYEQAYSFLAHPNLPHLDFVSIKQERGSFVAYRAIADILANGGST